MMRCGNVFECQVRAEQIQILPRHGACALSIDPLSERILTETPPCSLTEISVLRWPGAAGLGAGGAAAARKHGAAIAI